MMFESIEKSGLDRGLYNGFRRLDSFHSNFDSKLTAADGRYCNMDSGFNRNAVVWLGLESGTDLSDLHGSLLDAIKDMYNGSEVNGQQTLGLKEIHGWKREGAYAEINTKQQAGFAAEVISTTKENLISRQTGSEIQTYRTDDLVKIKPDEYGGKFRVNDPYVDKVRLDANGNIIERIQTKFVGNSAESCLSKLMSKKFDKYVFDGEVDKIEIPKEFYQEIREKNLIEGQRQKLQQQLDRVKAEGKPEKVVQSIEHKLDKLNRLDDMLEGSTVTMQEAIEGVTHPNRITVKLLAKEVLPAANDAGIKSGLVAAGITLAVSTADNISAFLDGEITAEDMVVDIIKETGASGVLGYGEEFISTAVSQLMSKSSNQMIQRVAGSTLPAAMVSFAVESYDSVSAYARGEIDGEDLAYELGENAVMVTGAINGSAVGATIGSALGPAGSIAGGIIGGVVGAAVASEAYATAVELGAEGVEFLAEKAESLMQGTLDIFQEQIPDKLDNAKAAFCDFIEEFDLPFSL